MDELDRQLHAIGTSALERLEAEAGADPERERRETLALDYLAGRLSASERKAVEQGLSQDPLLAHALARAVRDERPLDPERVRTILALASQELDGGVTALPWWRRLGVRFGTPAGAGKGGRAFWTRHGLWGAALATVVVGLIVFVPFRSWWAGPGPEAPPDITLELRGQQVRWMGDGEAHPLPDSASIPVYGPESLFEAVLRVAEEGKAVDVVVLARYPSGRVVVLAPGGPLEVARGPGGVRLSGTGRAVLGDRPGEVGLWFVVAPSGALPSPVRLAGVLESGADHLADLARRSGWWLESRRVRRSGA